MSDIEKNLSTCNWGGLVIAVGTTAVPEGKGLKAVTAVSKIVKSEQVAVRAVDAGRVAVPLGKIATDGAMVNPKAVDTLRSIRQTGVSPYRSAPFQNREGLLPTEVTYTEHDISPIVNPKARGLERLVTGSDGSAYYTSDHYETFTKMRN